MKKNVMITMGTVVILVLIIILLATYQTYDDTKPNFLHKTHQLWKQSQTIRFPDVPLRKNERIIAAELFFQNASIRSIKNIPPSWQVSINPDPPPNPSFSGTIKVGAAALGSTKELPAFEVDGYIPEEAPRAQKAVITVKPYPGDGMERMIEVNLTKP